jgi:hypothetical protein
MVVRRLGIVLVGAGGLVSLLVGGPSAAVAAPGGGGCQLAGSANLSPGLSNTAQNFTYSFSGALSGCQSNIAGAPASGNVEAGKTVTVPYNWTYTDSLGVVHSGTANATYQEPIPAGNGSCASSTTAGTALATWADGTATAVGYTTTGALALVHLTGTVGTGITDTLVSYTGPTQAPPASTHTVSTTRFAADSALGELTFQPPDPTACGAAGVTTAAISGFIGIGSQ